MKIELLYLTAVAVAAWTCLAGNAATVRDLPFPLTSVRLTGGPLQAQQEQNRRYLLRLEPDRLLSRFRSEAGLKPKAEPYGGWENPALKRDKWIALPGHILAFWLSGAAMTFEATGDAELTKRLLYVVRGDRARRHTPAGPRRQRAAHEFRQRQRGVRSCLSAEQDADRPVPDA